MDRWNTMVASRGRIFRVTGNTARPRAPFSPDAVGETGPGQRKARKEEEEEEGPDRRSKKEDERDYRGPITREPKGKF